MQGTFTNGMSEVNPSFALESVLTLSGQPYKFNTAAAYTPESELTMSANVADLVIIEREFSER